MNESFTNSIIGSEAFDKNIVLNRVIFFNRLLWQRISVMLSCVPLQKGIIVEKIGLNQLFSENVLLKIILCYLK